MTHGIKSLQKTQILLNFKDEATADYVRKVCRRKAIDLEAYIVDNFEWDSQPECIANPEEKIIHQMCRECEESEHCPDVVKRIKRRPRASV